ncbi:MAG: hypothetical protein LBK73_03825 [Treponema sp.]|jgi:hypothetical protein|nr:hypothetical protein [Treponema sp.]
MEGRTGHWMSGAEDLDTYYQSELLKLREMDQEEKGRDIYCFLNYDIVTIAYEHNFALLRRNTHTGTSAGEYIMLNLATGEETYICDSYTREKGWHSGMDETFEWLDANRLQLDTITGDNGAERLNIVYDGSGWRTEEARPR